MYTLSILFAFGQTVFVRFAKGKITRVHVLISVLMKNAVVEVVQLPEFSLFSEITFISLGRNQLFNLNETIIVLLGRD